MCLGLAVPAFAAESNWNLEVLGKSDAEVFVGEKTFTLRDWVWSYSNDWGASIVTKTDSRQWTVSNVCVMSADDVAVFTNGGESFETLNVTAWSDPDGDGVYDMRLINLYGNDPRVPADTAGPLRSGDDDGYGGTDAWYTNRNVIHMVSMGYLHSVGFSEYPEYGYIDPIGDGGVDPVTELKLCADDLLYWYGPNTVIWITPQGVDERLGWAVLLEGNTAQPTVPTVGNFTDVKTSDYFAEPVAWAVEKNITQGTGNGQFSPSATCNQGQILTFLWRAEGEPKPTGTVSGTQYYAAAAQWAKEQGLTDNFSAEADCTRAMVVTYLWKLAGSPSAGTSDFTDVPANADYAQAVAWAVENEITSGMGDGQFSPNSTCTRGQIVTFLYRAFTK